MSSGRTRRCKDQFFPDNAANGWPIINPAEPLSGAAMNAILHFPPNLVAELHELKAEVELHRREVVAAATVFELTGTARATQSTEVTRQINALRQRLANLLA